MTPVRIPLHEDRCTRCGECCRDKHIHHGRRVISREFCPGLDVKTKTCRIYWNRQKILSSVLGLRCLIHEEALALKEYPPHCTYIGSDTRGLDEYNPAEFNAVPRWVRAKWRWMNLWRRMKLSWWLLRNGKRRA